MSTALLLCITWGAFAQEYVPYIPEDQLSDVVACIPAPPNMKSAEFTFISTNETAYRCKCYAFRC